MIDSVIPLPYGVEADALAYPVYLLSIIAVNNSYPHHAAQQKQPSLGPFYIHIPAHYTKRYPI